MAWFSFIKTSGWREASGSSADGLYRIGGLDPHEARSAVRPSVWPRVLRCRLPGTSLHGTFACRLCERLGGSNQTELGY